MTEPVNNIPFIDLGTQRRRLRRSLDDAMQRVMDHGQYILGPEVIELESQLAAIAGAKHCVSGRATRALSPLSLLQPPPRW